MPLLQEVPKRELGGLRSEVKNESDEALETTLNRVGFTHPNTAMFTPSQLLVASQTAALMAASGLGLPANPAFFHPGIFASAWNDLVQNRNSPPSPINGQLIPLRGGGQLSPLTAASRKHNNNNVVSSSSGDVKQPKRKYRKIEEEVPLSPPNSGSPPSSSGETASPGVLIKEGSRDKQFTCGVCNRSFGYKHVLQNHERTHTGEKPFECPECHKRFTRDHHLKTHMRLHTGERPYHCEYCDRQFVQVANLRRHLRVHTGERPYACQYCTARFSDSNQLKAHVLIHKGEKPFQCSSCGGKFRRRHHLLHHKCGTKEATIPDTSSPRSDVSEEYLEDRRQPLVKVPIKMLPEQTEPEDLSMSTGLHSHSSESPRSRSPLSHDEDELDDAAALWRKRNPS